MNETEKLRSRKRSGDEALECALLAGIAQGQINDFDQLFHQYHDRLFRFVWRVTGSTDLVEEVTNDTMLAVWKQAAQFQHRSKVSTWIFGIAYRTALRALRKNKRHQQNRMEQDLELLEMESQRENTELRDLVEIALRRLTPDQRAIVELTYYMGCSYEEIAATLSCPVGTVKSRMFSVKKKLRPLLEQLA